jgi:hypothetical protein
MRFLLFLVVVAPSVMAARIEHHIAVPENEHLRRHEHEAKLVMQRRQDLPAWAHPVEPVLTTSTTVLTYITPSPSATPIAVTIQSQMITSYQPLVTFCAMPPLVLVSGSWINTATTGPYLNASLAKPSGTSSCDTSYAPIPTKVCATTLTGLASKITITACEQNVTFSSQFGYTLETPSASNISNTSLTTSPPPSPTIRNLTTYYIAPWQSLAATPGVAPRDVDIKICSTYSNASTICSVEYQEWHVAVVTIITTTTYPVDLTATYPGPGEIIVHTAHWTVTDTLTTFALTSTFEVETSVETESTSMGTRGPRETRTLTVVYNTANGEDAEGGTSTVVAFTTSTTYEGTSTAVVTPSI